MLVGLRDIVLLWPCVAFGGSLGLVFAVCGGCGFRVCGLLDGRLLFCLGW